MSFVTNAVSLELGPATFLEGRYGGGKEPIHPQLEERRVTRRSPQRIPMGAPE